MSTHVNRAAKRCPSCGSTETKHKDDSFKEVNHRAGHIGVHQLHGALSGHPGGLMIVGGLWAAAKVVNAISKPWSCKCGHAFH
jgi:hypothetical protein